MNRILVLIEGSDEERPVVKGLGADALKGDHLPYKCTLPDQTEFVICTTGVGPERAKQVTLETIDLYKPTLVISTGTCGALTADMEVEDWLLTGSVRSIGAVGEGGRPEIETITSNAHAELDLLRRALGAGEDAPRLHDGLLVSVSGEPVIDEEDKDDIVRSHGAIAADMESYGIAAGAQERGLPWLVARVVVDTPAIPLPDFGDLNVATGRPSMWRLLGYVLKHPIAGPRRLYGLWALVQVYSRHLVRALPALANGQLEKVAQQ